MFPFLFIAYLLHESVFYVFFEFLYAIMVNQG